MIILSNCLTETADEGCRKVANSLIGRIKKAKTETTVVSYESVSCLSDVHLKINKLLLNRELAMLLWRRKEPLLYIPSPAKMRSTALRLFVLSWYARWGLCVLLPMKFPVDKLSRKLILASGAQIASLSRESWEHYGRAFGKRAVYLKTGVDTQRFVPADDGKKQQLREKYGIPNDKTVVLHVGHLKKGRNIEQLTKINEEFQVILVVSTQTVDQRDEHLRRQLEAKQNLKILDDFIPDIEEIYQLSDVYLFPVEQAGNCIDVPVSALEAAACGIPVVTTAYGELKNLLGEAGFYEITSFDAHALNAQLKDVIKEGKSARESVLEYDWSLAVRMLLSDRKQEE